MGEDFEGTLVVNDQGVTEYEGEHRVRTPSADYYAALRAEREANLAVLDHDVPVEDVTGDGEADRVSRSATKAEISEYIAARHPDAEVDARLKKAELLELADQLDAEAQDVAEATFEDDDGGDPDGSGSGE